MKNTDLVVEFTKSKVNDLDEALKSKVSFTRVLDYYHIKWIETCGEIICKCPFHADTGENLSFSLEKGTYKCSVCGETGDIFRFVQSMEHCTDNQTFAIMCAIGGITNSTIGLEKNDRINARAELCARSGYSASGVGTIRELVETAKTNGITALALCDDYSTAGYKEFAFYCKKMAIDAIFGVTIVVDDKRVAVLAKNKNGIVAINTLISISKPKTTYTNDYSDLEKFKDNIITIGILDKYEDLDELIQKYDLIGAKDNGNRYPESFYSMSTNDRIVAISDSYYPNKEDLLLHDSLINFKSYYLRKLRNRNELLSMFPNSWVEDNTINAISDIEDDCFNDNSPIKFPKLISNEDFTKLVKGLIAINFKKESSLFKDQVEAELKSVIYYDYASIYYLLYLISEYAHKHNQTINLLNNGTASLLTYVLGISDINPKQYDLVAEAFLGYDFDKMPDFDIKVASSFANECEQYLITVFKQNNIIKAGHLSTYSNEESLDIVKKYLISQESPYYQNIEDVKVFKLANTVKNIDYKTNRYILKNEEDNILEITPIKESDDGLSFALNDISSIWYHFYDISILINADLEMVNDFRSSRVIDYESIPLNDKKVLSLFESDKALNKQRHILPNELNNPLNGISEFGTPFATKIVSNCKPKSLDDLIKISGFAHGTNVWNNNGEYLIQQGYQLDDLVATRDDVFNVLTQKYFVSRRTAFMIMEDVRKGRGLRPQYEKILIGDKVPNHLIWSLNRILYMASKGMCVTYTINAYKQAYFKIYYPEIFYQSLINNKYIDAIKKIDPDNLLKQIMQEKLNKEESEALFIIYEMVERGYYIDWCDDSCSKVKVIKLKDNQLEKH